MTSRMLQGAGAPSFCWHCFNQLQRAPGKGRGLFYFTLVADQDGRHHRIHGHCEALAIADGAKKVSS